MTPCGFPIPGGRPCQAIGIAWGPRGRCYWRFAVESPAAARPVADVHTNGSRWVPAGAWFARYEAVRYDESPRDEAALRGVRYLIELGGMEAVLTV